MKLTTTTRNVLDDKHWTGGKVDRSGKQDELTKHDLAFWEFDILCAASRGFPTDLPEETLELDLVDSPMKLNGCMCFLPLVSKIKIRGYPDSSSSYGSVGSEGFIVILLKTITR